MRWRSYRYYRDRKVKTPALAFLMDRSFIYVITAIIAVIALLVWGTRSWAAYERIIAEPVENTPYIELTGADSPATLFASDFIKIKPEQADGTWKTNDATTPDRPFDEELCGYHDPVSPSILSTHNASNAKIETRVQTYAAGQARKSFEEYRELDCMKDNDEVDTDNGVAVISGNLGMVTMGDVVLTVSGNDAGITQDVLSEYAQRLSADLKSSQCLALDVTVNDAARNPYVNAEGYTGKIETKEITTGVSTEQINVPHTEVNLGDIENPDMDSPEAPLPNGFPELPKSEIERPDVPARPEIKNEFKDTASFVVSDRDGPGCGWQWSGYRSPVFDDNKLVSEMDATLSVTQENVDSQAQDYVNTQHQWSEEMVTVLPRAESWNDYVVNVNDVHDSWSWLTEERRKLIPAWNQYLYEYEQWNTFYDRQDAAAQEYDAQLNRCLDAQTEYDEWEDQWGDVIAEKLRLAEEDNANNELVESAAPESSESPEPSSSPSPTESSEPSNSDNDVRNIEVPEAPAGCSDLPERPAILDQERGAEPNVPAIPEGVTIPLSWENPKGVYGDVPADFSSEQ